MKQCTDDKPKAYKEHLLSLESVPSLSHVMKTQDMEVITKAILIFKGSQKKDRRETLKC